MLAHLKVSGNASQHRPPVRSIPAPHARGARQLNGPFRPESQGVSNPNELDYLGSHDDIEIDVRRDFSGIALAAATVTGYISLGVVVFSYILGDWEVSDSLWFILTSLTTVGYGDLAPDTPELKAFTIFYILGGSCIAVSALGVVLASLASSFSVQLQASKDEQRTRALEILSEALCQQAEAKQSSSDSGPTQQSGSSNMEPFFQSITGPDSHAELRPSFIILRELAWLSSLLAIGAAGCTC